MKMIDFCALPNVEVATQSATVGASSATLLSLLAGGALHGQTQYVGISVETADIRLTRDNTTPTSSLGELIPYDSGKKILSMAEALNAKVIRAGGTNAAIQIWQYKQ